MKKLIQAGIVIALGLSTAACSSKTTEPSEETDAATATATSDATAETGPSNADQGSVILRASWGSVDDKVEEPVPPTPTIVSQRKGQQQKFEREASKRWKNTEIFVGR